MYPMEKTCINEPIPVIIIVIQIAKASTCKPAFRLKLDNFNRENKGTFIVESNERKMLNEITNGIATISVPIVPTTVSDKFFPIVPFRIPPISGKSKTNSIKVSVPIDYPFKLLNKSASIFLLLRYARIRMERPTVASAAATTTIKKTKICASP